MMTSFVQEVLAASGRSSGEKKDDFSLRATKLKNRVDELKFSLRERIESRYEDFSASFFEVSTTVNQLEDILRDIDNLEQSINFRIKAGFNGSPALAYGRTYRLRAQFATSVFWVKNYWILLLF